MAGVDVTLLDNGLRQVERRYRNHDYVVTELPFLEYERLRKKATTKNEDTGLEDYDGDAHNAFLMGACVKEDGKKVTADTMYERGTGVVRQLQRDISLVHFDEEKNEEKPEPKDDGEGEANPATTSAKAK